MEAAVTGGGSITVPAGIFSAQLGTLESVTRYLREKKGMRFNQIARLLNRDTRTIWGAYQSSTLKQPEPFTADSAASGTLELPVEIFSDRLLGMLESAAWYMRKSLGMSYAAIARAVQRDYSTVWTAFTRAETKRRALWLASQQKQNA